MTTLKELLDQRLLQNQIGMGKECREIVIETVNEWLSWWERDMFDHLKWCQNRKISTDAAMGRLHQIQEIRQGLTDKQFIDSPNAKKEVK